MRGNMKQVAPVWIAVVLIITTIAVGYFALNGGFGFNVSGTCDGTSSATISRGSATVKPGQNLYRDVFFAHLTTSGSGECLAISLDESIINSELNSEGYTIDDSMFGNVRVLEQSITYAHDYEVIPVYGADVEEYKYSLSSCNLNFCKSKNPASVNFVRPGWGLSCYCITHTKVGEIADFSNEGSKSFRASITVGDSSTGYITNKQQSTKIAVGGKDIMWIKWTGDTESSFKFDSPKTEWYKTLAGDYRMVSSTATSNINTAWKSKIEGTQACVQTVGNRDALIRCINDYNSVLNNNIKDVLASWKSSKVNLSVKNAYFNGDKLVIDLYPNSVNFMSFDIEADVAWMGIHQVCTTPDVICPTTTIKVDGSETQEADIVIKNKGNSGTVKLSVECDEGLASGTITPSIDLDSGDSGTIRVSLSSAVKQKETGKCTITAVSGGPKCDDQDICTIRVEATPGGCDAGEVKCIDNFLYTCVDGTFQSTFCEYGCADEKCKPPIDTCATFGEKKCSGKSLLTCGADGHWSSIDCEHGCVDKKCATEECKNCWAWLSRGSNGCVASSFLPSKPTWNPLTWNPVMWFMSGIVTQDNLCPIIIGGQIAMFVILGLIIFIIVIVAMKYYRRK